jgi:signal transduction histidine kinase/CheY-like chemotaxis protein
MGREPTLGPSGIVIGETTRPTSYKGVGLAGRFAIAGGLLAMALGGAFAAIDDGLRHIQSEMESIVRVAQPMADAAYEMEINAIGAGLGVVKYLHAPDAAHRRRFEKDREDFRRFFERYRELASTDRQRDLAARIEARHDTYSTTGAFLLDARDRSDRDLAPIIASLRDIDRSLDSEIEGRPLADRERQAAVMEMVHRIKNGIWNVLVGLKDINLAEAHAERQIAGGIQAIRDSFAALARAAPELSGAAQRLGREFDAIAPRIEAAGALHRDMAEGLRRLILLRDEMDDILDEEIQMLTGEHLDEAMNDIILDVRFDRRALAAALAVSLAALTAMFVYTLRRVAQPIRVLADYAAEVGRGNFAAPMNVPRGTEVGALAQALAAMSGKVQHAIDAKDREAAERMKLQENVGHAERVASIGRLSGGIAHDFNNMLMVVGGHAENAIKRTGEPKVVEKSLRDILAAVGKATNLVRQLSIFGGRRAVEARVFDVARLKDDVDGLIQLVAGEQQTIEYEYRDSARVKADPGELTQAVLNLVTNASHASSPGSVIRVSVDTEEVPEDFAGARPTLKPGRYVVVAVADRGTGIPASVVPRIFEPFFTTKNLGDGTGLGLSMVYGFAEQSGGGVGLTTEIGQGTTFRIYLPVTELPEEIAEAQDENTPQGKGESILLVDDDARVLSLTRDVLQQLGYVVHAAKGGLEAVEIAADENLRIDLMLSDVIMPVLSGAEAYDIIREDRPGLPVVFMSGSPERLGAAKTPDHARLLRKPVRTLVLAQALRSALDGGAPKVPTPNLEPALT